MKITVSVEVDTPEQAREILAAVERIPSLPYRLDGFGARVLKAVDAKTTIAEKEYLHAGDTSSVSMQNVIPPGKDITKIGSIAKEHIMRILSPNSPATIQQIGKKYEDHLKLLCKRGEVKYDGERYYL